MACTTILVGKKASYDGSTMIARNDDSCNGTFTYKKFKVVEPSEQPRVYKSVISHLEIKLPDNPMRYTCVPNVDMKDGVWAACGINSANVCMTATETITSNARVMGADPLVRYQKGDENHEEVIGGLGEEDLVLVTLPYIHSAKEGVKRLGSLLEKYGTYEANGIAFSDENEIWWLETIGGHNWIARRVKDEEYVIMPNQFGLDRFDFKDALGEGKENLCSYTLKDLVDENHLDLNLDGNFNPRLAFGSHTDSDHVYNTPRAWYMGRYFNPRTYKWDGNDAYYTPESNDIPWSLVPEHKITVEDIKYILSSYYQGTQYNPYGKNSIKGLYRPIGINRTSFMSILQIRPYVSENIKGVQWLCFGSNAFNAIIPLYTNITKVPTYLSNTTCDVNTNNFYWTSRLISALADAHFNNCIVHIERYQDKVLNQGHKILNDYDKLISESKKELMDEANEKVVNMVQKEAQDVLNKIVFETSLLMKNDFSRSDN